MASKWWKWIINPVGAVAQALNDETKDGTLGSAISGILNPGDSLVQAFSGDKYHDIGDITNDKIVDPLYDYFTEGEGAEAVSKYWDNVTGERDTKENEKNRDFQSSEADIARSWETEQARLAREWDSIGAQMERAAKVGVNPISIAMQNGGINGSLGTSIPSSPGIPAGSSGLMHNGIMDIASAVFNGIGTFAEQRLKRAQSDDIVIMRKYNIAEKIANTDHLRNLCENVGLSNIAQSIQNRWLDVMNQATYDGMLLENGVKFETIREKRSIAKLNLQQVESVRQSMDIALKSFNSKLPLELQLMETQIDLNKMSASDLYSEICLRYLQSIEQQQRNIQATNETTISNAEAGIAVRTYEDAINAFHNDMVKGAAEAGIALNDFMYYSVRPGTISNLLGSLPARFADQFSRRTKKRRNFMLGNVHGLE